MGRDPSVGRGVSVPQAGAVAPPGRAWTRQAGNAPLSDSGAPMTDIGWFVTFTVGLGVVFGTLEALVRTGRMGSETGRRISHVTACLYGVGIHAVLSMWWFVVVAGTFVVLMA